MDPGGSDNAVTVAAVQMNSGHELRRNLATTATLIAEASQRGARLAVLPENFAYLGLDERDKVSLAEDEGAGEIQDFVANLARENSLWIIAGSVPLRSPDPKRCFGASIVFDDDGCLRCCYRKMHLFDVDLPGRDEAYRESATMYPGGDIRSCDTPLGRVGLSICYDLRFPELYRKLVDEGATAFTVPSAFTATTGSAHWQPLLRARAIENLAYVIAPGQSGRHSNGRTTYGHSMIVGPWGDVIAELEDGEGVVVARLYPDLPAKLRDEFPVHRHRRITSGERK
ncbi:MAG: carbon-nitrogen hydrolase family protein [Gammaproteobacteria bacterium]|nr:carbon-nitrogen hydrolase family protein [Gammaproteobacteria bacterium]